MALRVVSRAKETAEPAAARPLRRLMAVMLADVVDYSRMMSQREEETHARITRLARELIEPAIERNGRLVRSIGDGWLAEFTSATEAVRCALSIQHAVALSQADEADRIQLRIGINTGDVLVDQHDIYGNSVNIAARLEALAAPGTIWVSQGIFDQARAHPGFHFADRGARRVKNIPYPIRVYQVADQPIRLSLLARLAARGISLPLVASVAAAAAITAAASVLVLRAPAAAVARTSRIVVLPFRNAGDASDGYLADAITDELTSELSRLRRAWVISSGTAFAYKNRPDDPREIGRELKVRYALDGNVRRDGAVVRVSASLIDTESGVNVWANSFTYQTTSLIDLQERLLGRIAVSLKDEVVGAGVRHEVGTLAADHNPLDESMRAMAAASTAHPTPETSLETRQHVEAGLKADPENARLLGRLASILTSDVLNGWNGAGPAEVARAEAAARKAISLDYNTPRAHYALGYVYRLQGNHQAAFDSFNETVKLDANFARAYVQAANEMVFLGKPADAIPMVETAFQLSPADTSVGVFYWVKGRAAFALGDYPNAIPALQEAVRLRPNLWFTHVWLVAAEALVGQDVAAAQALAVFKARYGADYDLARIARYYQEEQYNNPTLQAAAAELLKGLQKAGLS